MIRAVTILCMFAMVVPCVTMVQAMWRMTMKRTTDFGHDANVYILSVTVLYLLFMILVLVRSL